MHYAVTKVPHCSIACFRGSDVLAASSKEMLETLGLIAALKLAYPILEYEPTFTFRKQVPIPLL
jgi:hypothetical protein